MHIIHSESNFFKYTVNKVFVPVDRHYNIIVENNAV